jgi:hypothetical protein
VVSAAPPSGSTGPGARLTAVLHTIMTQPAGPLTTMLCAAAAQKLEVEGTSLTVAVADDQLQTVDATALGEVGDRTQEDLGEGPSLDAHRAGVSVLAPDLGDDRRWPALAYAASRVGILAAFAFPLRRGAIRLGTLNLYRRSAGGLDGHQQADAVMLGGLAVDLLSSDTSGPVVGDGLAAGGNGEVPEGLAGRMWPAPHASSPQVHQATGMVAVQLELAMADALATIRAHAFTTDRHLSAVAADVVARRLRFDAPQEPASGP